MKKQVHWLLKELDLWVQEGLINDGQAGAIRARYPADEQAGSWGRIAFAVAGVVLIGLGVILFFAYNWDKMPKFAKLGVVFAALIGAHGAALATRRPAARETLHVLGTMFFGAGIWLVAQIYHINEHYPTAFLVWALAALSLAWILPSLAQSLIATTLLVIWTGSESFGFQNPEYAGPVLVLIGVLPLAWVLRSRVFAGFGLASFLLALFFVLQRWNGSLLMAVFFCIAGTLIAAGLILGRSPAPELAPAGLFFGNVIYFLILFILTFHGVREPGAYIRTDHAFEGWFLLFPAVGLGLWAGALAPFRTIKERLHHDLRPDYLVVPPVLLLYTLQFYRVVRLRGVLASAPYDLLILFSAVVLMLRGFKSLHLRPAVMGSLLLTALAAARYADLFQSLLARAAVFVVVGGIMIAIGVFFARARRAPGGAA